MSQSLECVDIDADIESPDKEVLCHHPAELDVEEVVGIGDRGANHVSGDRGIDLLRFCVLRQSPT